MPASHWDRIAGQYRRAREGYPPDAVEWIRSQLPANGVLLDLGCGPHVVSGRDARLIIGLDLSATMLQVALRTAETRLANPRPYAVVGRAERLPLHPASVDVALALQSFHHFDASPALKEIARVLVPAGRLVIGWNLLDASDAATREYADSLDLLACGGLSPGRPPTVAERFHLVSTSRHTHEATYRDLGALLQRVATTQAVAHAAPGDVERLVGGTFRRYAGPEGLTLCYVTVLRSYMVG